MADTTQADQPKHPGGRPLKFKNAKELQERIDAYFADCDPHLVEHQELVWHKKKVRRGTRYVMEIDRTKKPTFETRWHMSEQVPYTITGLAVFLDTSRRTLINYENRDDKFFHTIKGAKDKIESFWEMQLLGPHATGPIFNLKNNYEWKDKTEQELTGADGEALIPVVRIIDERPGKPSA